MRIAVFARPVHNPALPIEPGPTLLLEGLPGYAPVPNPLDEVALEWALRLRERASFPVTLLVCSVGGEGSRRVLEELVACGVDDAVWIEEAEWEPDGGVVANRLWDWARAEPFDLGLFGMRDLDTGAGEVGRMFAALSAMDYIDSVVALEWRGDRQVVATRKQKRLREEIRVSLPACLGIPRGAPLRYPSFWGKRKAETSGPRTVSPREIPDGPRIERKKFSRSKPRRGSVAGEYAQSHSVERMRQALGLAGTAEKGRDALIRGEPEETAGKILKILEEEKIISSHPSSPEDA